MKRIHFEDHGQDFLWWDIDEEGCVIDCGPFQADVWIGVLTSFPKNINVGDKLIFVGNFGPRELNYRVEKIVDIPHASN